jgi:cell division protein FtsB
MRWSTLLLLTLLAIVQGELWLGKGGSPRAATLARQVADQKQKNDAARQRNEQLAAEVNDLKEGLEMVEEKARADLGMVKPDEVLVQIAPHK